MLCSHTASTIMYLRNQRRMHYIDLNNFVSSLLSLCMKVKKFVETSTYLQCSIVIESLLMFVLCYTH